MSGREHILVIRLGALGDLVFCMQSFHEIRQAHPKAKITLLTRAPYAEFARMMPWFDRVMVEAHPGLWQISAWTRLRRHIKELAPTRIYDLQGKNRQTVLYALLGGPFGPDWSGAAPLCRFPRLWPPKPGMHFTGFLAAQLREAGVSPAPPFSVKWLDAQVGRFALPKRYAVLIPGSSPNALFKRWQPRKYAEVAEHLAAFKIPCVIVGTKSDARAANAIAGLSGNVIDLCGQTKIAELAAVIRRSIGVIGGDTGPLHLAAALGKPTVGLFSGKSNQVWSKPPGKWVAVQQSAAMSDLSVDDVTATFESLVDHAESENR